MSESLDYRAKKVPILCEAGDSISFNVHVADIDNLTNPVFTGRARNDDGSVVEDFEVTPTATGAVVRLTPISTRTLGELAGTGQRIVMGDSSPAVWRGRYDVQLAHEPEMVRTLVKGPLSIEEDVTP